MADRSDLIETLLFLLNDNNNYITGQNILVDGGKTLI
jgi:NAD(P)-dependent dehydrogenase (short-subunit alcohol dehydrogenase family)